MSEISCKIILLKERGKMIATALQIQQATGEAVTDISSMMKAKNIFDNHNTMSKQELASALWEYSAHLSALTASMVTHICLTAEQLSAMVDEIEEFDELEELEQEVQDEIETDLLSELAASKKAYWEDLSNKNIEELL